MITPIFTLIGTVLGGVISYFLQKQRFNQDFKIFLETYKTDFMAESTIKHFLNDKKFKERKFSTIQKHLRGFEEDELRKLLIRAGAICKENNDGEELWGLLEDEVSKK